METEYREQCLQCFRPRRHCLCPVIPDIHNRTPVLILQHVGERWHPFNTARMVSNSLRSCQLIIDHNRKFQGRSLPILKDAGLLFPRAEAATLADLPDTQRPRQLVMVDGTWHQAKTIVRDTPQLRQLPCYRLSPTLPGQYRIRREPDGQSLSTLEATVAALRELEPETPGLDELLNAFHTMVERQLGYSSAAVRRFRRPRSGHLKHVPSALLGDPARLVVAYGEATPGGGGCRPGRPRPVNWWAARLDESETFGCCLDQPEELAPTALGHMRLSADHFRDAISEGEFRRRWEAFLRPNDVLIVYHQKTYHLLNNLGAVQPRCLVLKSIYGKMRQDFRTLEELAAAELVSGRHDTIRAEERLQLALGLVRRLRARGSNG